MLRSAPRRTRVKSGVTRGGGVAQTRHGKPSQRHGALPYLVAQQPPCSAWVLDGRVSRNKECYRSGTCNRSAFYPWSGAAAEEEASPKPKALEQARLADHGLDSARATYADFRLAATQAVRKQHLLCTPPGEAEPAAHLAKRTRRRQRCSKALARRRGHEHGHNRWPEEPSRHQGDDAHRSFREQRPEDVADCLAGGQGRKGQ